MNDKTTVHHYSKVNADGDTETAGSSFGYVGLYSMQKLRELLSPEVMQELEKHMPDVYVQVSAFGVCDVCEQILHVLEDQPLSNKQLYDTGKVHCGRNQVRQYTDKLEALGAISRDGERSPWVLTKGWIPKTVTVERPVFDDSDS